MDKIFSSILAMFAMLVVAFITGMCIFNDYDHGIAYAGLMIVSGLGGYFIANRLLKK